MATTTMSTLWRVPAMPGPPPLGSATGLSYGKQQEMIMRQALESGPGLDVRYSTEIDTVYKLDAVVIDHDRPLRPPVGVQFTTIHDEDKVRRTIDMVRRTRIVARLLYLESECRLEKAAFQMIRNLVMFVATAKPDKGIVTVVLAKDTQGRFTFRDLRCFSMEAEPISTRDDHAATKRVEKEKERLTQ